MAWLWNRNVLLFIHIKKKEMFCLWHCAVSNWEREKKNLSHGVCLDNRKRVNTGTDMQFLMHGVTVYVLWTIDLLPGERWGQVWNSK